MARRPPPFSASTSSSSSSSISISAAQDHQVRPRPSRIPTGQTSQKAIFQHTVEDPTPAHPLVKEWEPGRQPDEVYDAALPAWRAGVRQWMVRRLEAESPWMAKWQEEWRGSWCDGYFYWTAIFGTHTFFMTFLPLFFFFGDPERGRGMLHVVSLGIYTSSFVKDLFCAPRPYSPPVVRLSMSTHHHEYGFPSSHSTNSVSIALYAAQWIWEVRDAIGYGPLVLSWLVLFTYAFSVVFGRLYTGMHSIVDIVGGSLMGLSCNLLLLYFGPAIEGYVNTGSHLVPPITIITTLAVVHYHPEPVDDCPCFEDAIAVMSVVAGSFLGHWWVARYAPGPSLPGSLARFGFVGGMGVAVIRVVLGIGMIFVWRLLAKGVLLRTLPPLFRSASRLFDMNLPTRRFYMAATDYKEMPSQPLRAIPSMVDLQSGSMIADTPESLSPTDSLTPTASVLSVPDLQMASGLRKRLSGKENAARSKGDHVAGKVKVSKRRRMRPAERAKYDAEVLTKVGVYTGIGLIATTISLRLFDVIEQLLMR